MRDIDWGAALGHWRGPLSSGLDSLEAMHVRATGQGPGRRVGTEEFNGQLYVALVGRFQEYARALHDEARDAVASGETAVHRLFAESAGQRRRLDKGNPWPSELQADFSLIGLDLLTHVKERRHGPGRLEALGAAVMLRNGPAHGDREKVAQAHEEGARPTLSSFRAHRAKLGHLAVDMSQVVEHHVHSIMEGE